MKYLVPPPSCFGGVEFRTRLKLILHNNACAVIRDTKTRKQSRNLYSVPNGPCDHIGLVDFAEHNSS